MIKFTAKVLTEALAANPSEPSFAGHVGGDDFVLIVHPDVAEPISNAIIEGFDSGIAALYDSDDRERGTIRVTDRQGEVHEFAIVSIAVGVAQTTNRPIRTQWEASAIATEMKSHAKRLRRSAYEIDRREA